jgi:RNA polymerase sigma-B factor
LAVRAAGKPLPVATTTTKTRSRAGRRPLAPSERSTQVLLRRLRRDGDSRARETLLRRFLPLARKLARRYHGGGEPLEDLVQVASLGLVKALHRYDVDRGVSFSSYAVPTITGELKRYFRDNAWAVHVPRGMRERALQVHNAIRALSERTGRSPSTREIARHLKIDEQEVLDARIAYVAFDAMSLDAPVTGDESEQQPRGETLGEIDEGYGLAEERVTVGRAVRKLPPEDRRVLHMRFIEDRTQSDIAGRIGVSQMQVSRILRRTLERLRLAVDRPASLPPRRRLPPRRARVAKS